MTNKEKSPEHYRKANELIAESMGWWLDEDERVYSKKSWMGKSTSAIVVMASNDSYRKDYWNPLKNWGQLISVLKNMIGDDEGFLWQVENFDIRNALLYLNQEDLYWCIHKHLLQQNKGT